jgi:hypothetical protein
VRSSKSKSSTSSASASRKKSSKSRPKAGTRYWSGEVTRTSDALDQREGVFTLDDPEKIAASLLRSAEESKRKKAGSSYRSAMSMLTFYMNRAGKNLPAERLRILERAKDALRRMA